MLGRKWRVGTLAMAAALLTAGLSQADDDTVRLGRTAGEDTPAQGLIQRVDDAEVIDTRGRGGAVAFRGGGGRGFAAVGYRGGGGRGFAAVGYRGGGGVRVGVGVGGYRGYGYRGYGYGYRGYGWGGVRVGVGVGGYRGYGYRPYYGYGYGVSYPYYYSYPVVGCNYVETYPAQDLTLQYAPQQQVPLTERGSQPLPPPQALPPVPNVPYRYDGGPANPVPMPKAEPEPKAQAAPAVDRFVSSPAPKKYSFAAYGEKETEKPKADDLFVKLK